MDVAEIVTSWQHWKTPVPKIKREHCGAGLLHDASTWFVCASTGGHSGFGHAVPARVAVNMILCCASGGSLAVAIACWAQVGKEEEEEGGESVEGRRMYGCYIYDYCLTHAHMHTCTPHTHIHTYTKHTHNTHTSTHIQVRYHAATVNANEIANGVLSCLVAITSSCALLEYFEACIVGGASTANLFSAACFGDLLVGWCCLLQSM